MSLSPLELKREVSGPGLKSVESEKYPVEYFRDTVDFNPGTGTFNLISKGITDIYIQKLDSTGNFLWAKQMGSTGWDECRSIVTDAKGSVYSTGFFSDTADFDPGIATFELISKGDVDIYVQKLDSAGNFLWVEQMGGIERDWGLSLSVDTYGNVYSTGYFEDTVDFDPGVGTFNLTSNGFEDIYIQKLDSSGNFQWVKQIGGVYDDHGLSIIVDDSKNIYLTGLFIDSVDFDPGPNTFNLTTLSVSGYVQKLDSLGRFLWAKRIGGDNHPGRGISITYDSKNIVIAGTFKGTGDFDPGPDTFNLVFQGNWDIYVLKLSPCIIVDTDVTLGGSTLTAKANSASYQWLYCDSNYALISGQTAQFFTPTSTGSYAVEITQNACVDTSACYIVTISIIIENNLSDRLSVYPNPTTGELVIDLGRNYKEITVEMSNLTGQIVSTRNFESSAILKLAMPTDSGLYLLTIFDGEGHSAVVKIVKE